MERRRDNNISNEIEPERQGAVLRLDMKDFMQLYEPISKMSQRYEKSLIDIANSDFFNERSLKKGIAWHISEIPHLEQDANGCLLTCARMLIAAKEGSDLGAQGIRDGIVKEILGEKKAPYKQAEISQEPRRGDVLSFPPDFVDAAYEEKLDRYIDALENYQPVDGSVIKNFLKGRHIELEQLSSSSPKEFLKALGSGKPVIVNISFTSLVSPGRTGLAGEHAILIKGIKRNVDNTLSFQVNNPMTSESQWIED